MDLNVADIDMKEDGAEALIECDTKEVMRIKPALESKGYKVLSAESVTIPKQSMELGGELIRLFLSIDIGSNIACCLRR